MPNIDLPGNLSVHYLDPNPNGSSPVLLLHGLGVTGESWSLQVPKLIQSGYRVLVPDARGFGRSTYPGVCTVPLMAADMAALLTELGAYPVSVVGISMGGTIALQLTLDYPQFVTKLILVNTFAALRPEWISEWIYFLFRFMLVHTLGLPTQAHFVSQRLFPLQEQSVFREAMYEQIMQANPDGYRAAMRALARFDVRDRLSSIQTPTLVITGDNDTTVNPKIQRRLVEGIPGARQVVIPEAGHGLIADQPDEFLAILLEFLNS